MYTVSAINQKTNQEIIKTEGTKRGAEVAFKNLKKTVIRDLNLPVGDSAIVTLYHEQKGKLDSGIIINQETS